jgi:hypothetical protein
MHTPTSALAWELWRKNQRHLTGIAGILLFFILAYPGLCAFAGFNPDSTDAADEFARRLAANLGPHSFPDVVRVISLLFLAGGPLVAMVLTLVYVTWMFTFTEANPKTKDPMAFSAHVFNLPISTPALFWRLVLGGSLAILGLLGIWVHCVHVPHFEIFNFFNHGCLWVTLLVLAQAIVWSLAAWPFLRMLTLIVVSWPVVVWLAETAVITSPLVFVPLLVTGLILGRAGLEKMRHGQWQDWTWPLPKAFRFVRTEIQGPPQFALPIQAQVWLEWRRAGLGLVVPIVLLELVPVIFLLLRRLAGYDRLSEAAMDGFSMYLAYLPLFLFLIFGVSLGFELSQGKRDQPFVLVRPLASGELVMSLFHVTASGALLTWGAVLGVFALLPLLGNFSSVAQTVSPLVGVRIALVVGLIFLTWRLAVVNLCFGLTGRRWVSNASVLVPLVLGIGAGVGSNFPEFNSLLKNWVFPHVSALAASLLALKLLLAGAAFRACLQQNLLARADLVRYLTAWLLLVAALLATFLLLVPLDKDLIFPASLGIVLLVPLARLGFAPLALASHRHA